MTNEENYFDDSISSPSLIPTAPDITENIDYDLHSHASLMSPKCILLTLSICIFIILKHCD